VQQASGHRKTECAISISIRVTRMSVVDRIHGVVWTQTMALL